ncbi:MAG TPA: class I SAM-dependent methyltransferase [Candidatus Acidoferrum sp.]|nr:class I SAM-dependent methyltransferase [Candidatus Acidoferrum sp.]
MQEEPWYLQETIVKEYEAYYQTKYKRADVLEKKLLTELLNQFGDIKKVLEVGCGTSHFTRWMESLGLECYGLDLSHLMLEQARKLWPNGRLIQGESHSLPFRSGSFDVVAFIASLEYMPNIGIVFEEAARVARKGLVIGLMNKWSPSTIRRIAQAKIGNNPFYKNVKFYSILDIERILRETFQNRYSVDYWSTTVFPKVLGGKESSFFPFGSYLGLAVRLRGAYD